MPSLSSFMSSSSAAAASLGLGAGAGGGMGGIGMGGGIGSRNKPPIKRDPNLGTWEKHTKGIGMKLLSKMGYSGSGGLGAKRVRKKVTPPPGLDASASAGAGQAGLGLGAATAPAAAQPPPPSFATSTGGKEETEVVHRKGISRAIEVVVRPANLGLGFGNFKEQSQLRVNRQIEAEVRGIDFKKQEEDERKRKLKEEGRGDEDLASLLGVPKSLLPSTQTLLSEGGWRKGAAGRGGSSSAAGRRTKSERKFVSYQDLVKGEDDKGTEKIIDMRGPSASSAAAAASASTTGDGTVPLGEELLHNVTLLLNTYEDKVRSTSHYVKSNKRKVESLRSEMKETESRLDDVNTRISKLERVLDVFDRMERLHQENDSSAINGDDSDVHQAASLIAELSENFSKEEKSSLRFYSDVVPSLLGPIAERKAKDWQPLTRDGTDQSEVIMSSIVGLCSVANSSNEDGADYDIWNTKRSLFIDYVVPRVKRAFQSSRWDPIRDVESGVALYEAVLRVAKDSSPPERIHANAENDEDVLLERPYGSLHDDSAAEVIDVVRNSIMYDIIFPTLSRYLAQFKPSSSLVEPSTGKIQDVAPHFWLLPWLPYLDYKSMLPNLLPDVKRKLRAILSYLSRAFASGKDDLFFRSSMDTLVPWKDILDSRTVHSLSSDAITPRLGRHLARVKVVKSVLEQDWHSIDTLFEFHRSGLLSNRDFLSLLEGEVLSGWSDLLHTWLSSKEPDLVDVAKFYAEWKHKLFITPIDTGKQTAQKSAPWLVVREDPIICRTFYAVLRMLDAASKSDADTLEDLTPPAREEMNYHSALARRTKEERLREEAQMRARVAGDHEVGFSSHRGEGTATFRDVVEDFARQNDVDFTPRMGANALKDGKQTFLFGAVPVYLENNVAFALRGTSWQPTSLEDLVLAANSS